MTKATTPGKKLVILIVDDNVSFIDRMIAILDEVSNIGYIDVAPDYNEAYRILTEEKPDVVLLDINLPGKNGIDLLKKIKQLETTCRVIMITNHADGYYRQLCNDLGADHFLDKSNDFAKVPGIISGFSN